VFVGRSTIGRFRSPSFWGGSTKSGTQHFERHWRLTGHTARQAEFGRLQRSPQEIAVGWVLTTVSILVRVIFSIDVDPLGLKRSLEIDQAGVVGDEGIHRNVARSRASYLFQHGNVIKANAI
jgi:hypothetical protein